MGDSTPCRHQGRCIEADVPRPGARLRKAGATIAAENGATPYQLMSIFGWKTLEQAELYTKKVRQQIMAAGSMHMIAFDQIGNECVPGRGGKRWDTGRVKAQSYQWGQKPLALPSGRRGRHRKILKNKRKSA
jgi:hypothetical protein